MRIHVTKKLAEKLKKAGRFIEDNPAESTSVLDSWHANITTIQRRQCVVFVHDKTRFAIVLLGVTQKELKQIDYWFEDMLGNCMLKLGYDPELIEKACEGIGELTFDTQCDRSVQGTLKVAIEDLEAHTEGCTNIMDLAQYTLSARLCDRPCLVKGMKETERLWPRKEMQALLEQFS